MSNIVNSIVQRRKVGSPVRKSVLLYFADRASDDGSGVWSSKANIARDTEISIRAVQNAISELSVLGLISEVGKKPCRNGYTVEYRINIKVIEALLSTRASAAPPHEVHVSPAGGAGEPPQEVHPNLPLIIHEPPLLKVHFDVFWGLWPNKVAKPKAMASWEKLNAEDQVVIISLPSAGFETWQRNAPQRSSPIHPSTFLNNRRWEDAPVINGVHNGQHNGTNQQTSMADDTFANLVAETARAR